MSKLYFVFVIKSSKSTKKNDVYEGLLLAKISTALTFFFTNQNNALKKKPRKLNMLNSRISMTRPGTFLLTVDTFLSTYHTIHLHTFVLRLKAAKLHILPHYGGTKIRQMYRNDMVT